MQRGIGLQIHRLMHRLLRRSFARRAHARSSTALLASGFARQRKPASSGPSIRR
ncbi:hypothetical protein [Lysobacter gummosus]|uniref:hypothetical protein n=1 Tax=Lysobacter gummosus TaxID=262324 RepID=UPI0036360C16